MQLKGLVAEGRLDFESVKWSTIKVQEASRLGSTWGSEGCRRSGLWPTCAQNARASFVGGLFGGGGAAVADFFGQAADGFAQGRYFLLF